MDVASVVAYYKDKLESSPVKTLWPEERYALYTSFGPLTSVQYQQSEQIPYMGYENQSYYNAIRKRLNNRTIGDIFVGWLAILTAEQVLPIWERAKNQDLHPLVQNTAQEILALAKAEMAVRAYSATDPNRPWDEREGPALSIQFDQAKQAEFWNWWLTEAVPQAWQLAEQSYPPKQAD